MLKAFPFFFTQNDRCSIILNMNLLDNDVRVRFAPSPTGYLHIGGARTAIFNWMYAKKNNGKFILRIEDTDTSRNSDSAINAITSGLNWLGLHWDEDVYFQSKRKSLYRQKVDELLLSGHAYKSEGAIKFRMQPGVIVIPDLIIGNVTHKIENNEDFVIVRSNGEETFHLVNVVDDLDMNITHVIRGEDHLTNTAKHIAIANAFGCQPPKYAHIPLILNQDGSKMSKRDTNPTHAKVELNHYIESGFLPSAFSNYLSLLGWTPKNNSDIFTLTDVLPQFELKDIHRSNAKFDLVKLVHFNKEHSRKLSPDMFLSISKKYTKINLQGFSTEYINNAFLTVHDKGILFSEIDNWIDFYFISDDKINPSEDLKNKIFTKSTLPILYDILNIVSTISEFKADTIKKAFDDLSKEKSIKIGLIVSPCRVSCTGKSVGPSLFHLMEILGRSKVINRLTLAINNIN